MAELATIARPYAEAVYSMAAEKQQLDQWQEVLERLAAAVQTPEFEHIPMDPKITSEQLIELIGSVTKKDPNAVPAADLIKRFLRQMVSHRRLDTLPEVLKQFEKMRNAASNTAEVDIYTAFPFNKGQLEELLPTLEKRFGVKLKPQVHIDESLIGGICAVVGDDTLDLSVKARLERMKQALIA